MTAPPAVLMRGVVKRYGRTVALDGLDLTIPTGALVGLVGPNGAGKTTTFGIVGGAIRPDAGVVQILGAGAFDPKLHAGRVTLLPQDSELNPHTPVHALLTYFARLQGMDARRARSEVDRVIELVELADRARARPRQLSHGMRRRVAVAQALLGDPALVLLDEPTGGLDPHLVVEMRRVLLAERAKRTMVVSSHILADLEAVADHLVFLERGRVVRAGPASDVLRRAELVRVRLGAALDAARVRELFPALDVEAHGDELRVAVPAGRTVAELNAELLPALVGAGLDVLEVRSGTSLEDAYMAERDR